MRIEQALYGEVRGGHALRSTSGVGDLAGQLTSRLDLPDTAPLGVSWAAFFSGFPFGDRYVVARTMLDAGASRAGMVFSHALIAPLEQFVVLEDIRPVVELFDRLTDQQMIALPVLDLIPSEGAIPPVTSEVADTTAALASRGNGPVVRLGLDGFDQLVAAIWARLWPSIRSGFAFRLSFGPGDLVETPSPALVCTPASLAPRWSGFRVVGTAQAQAAESLVVSLLRGDPQGRALSHFASGIGATLATFPDLQLVERAYVFRTGNPQTIDHLIAAARLVERLSPDPSEGRDGKESLIADLHEQLSKAAASDILLLRNLELLAFPNGERVWNALERWLSGNRFAATEDADMGAIMTSALSTGAAVKQWRQGVLAGLTAAAAAGRGFASAYWRWAVERPEIINAISHEIADTAGIEKTLSREAPRQLPPVAASAVAETSRSLHWLGLHGLAVSAAFSPRIAVEQQLAIDRIPLHVAGLRNALRNATPAEVLSCALAMDEPRLETIAAEAVAADPHLLRNIDMDELRAQRIWALALDVNSGAWQGPPDPPALFARILDRIVAGELADNALIEALARSPIGDLNQYQRRAEVWPRVTPTARDSLLAATAAGWLRRATQGSIPFTPDAGLLSVILSGDAVDKAIDILGSTRIQTAVDIVAALETFEQDRFLRWLRGMVNQRTRLDEGEAASIGRLALTRRWRRAAGELAQAARSQSEFLPAVRVCSGLIGFWTRFRLGVSTVSSNEKWEFLEEVATELYPSGPDQEALWSRAGGNDADLHHGGSGRSRWRDALARVRRGSAMRVERLLRRMRDDYPQNEKLRYLADDHEFRGLP